MLRWLHRVTERVRGRFIGRAGHNDFVVEPGSDRFLVSFNPRGVLRRVR